MNVVIEINNKVDPAGIGAGGHSLEYSRRDFLRLEQSGRKQSVARRSWKGSPQNPLRSFSRIGLVRTALMFLFGLGPVYAYAVKPAADVLPGAESELPVSRPISYANATNEELDALGARWGYLSAPERRALLAEVRRRMAQGSNVSGNVGKVRIQTTRQFGVVKRPDGTMIRVERRVIRMIPAEQGYGTGFEQRTARDESSLPATPQEAQRRALEQERLKFRNGTQSATAAGAPQDGIAAEGVMPASTPSTVPELPDASPVSR